MKRRDFVKLVSGVAIWLPLTARAQQSQKPARIGVIMGFSAEDEVWQSYLATFRGRLQELGWAVGHAPARLNLPAIYSFRFYAASGGLISYGIDQLETVREAASYVNRILRGENPADLPLQLPTKYQLIVNLKTNKALGLSPPESFLQRVDEVIE